MRLTLKQFAESNVAEALGLCRGDIPRIADFANQAIWELMLAAPENGWSDGWAKLVINLPCTDDYITLPPEYSRLVNIDVCRVPIPVMNEWAEVMEAGIGLQSPCVGRYGCGLQAAFERANVPTAVDMPSSGHYVRVYCTDARDVNKRILFLDAKDSQNNGIYSTDIGNQINGFPLVFAQPFTTSAFIVTSFSAVQKDVTYGDIVLKAVNATTGEETFLSRYTPQQTNPVFRRYYLQAACSWTTDISSTTPRARQVTCMARYEYRPASQPTDLLLISNFPALMAKCEAIRLSRLDNPTALQMAAAKHAGAIRLLNKELATYHGISPALNVAPFGTARLERVNVGMI